MAAVGSTTTYETVGQKKDVDDLIHSLTPPDCPMLKFAKKGKAKAKYVEWQVRKLASVSNDNIQVEGGDAPSSAAGQPVMNANYTQILARTATVSGTAEAVDHYGRQSEMDRQLVEEGTQLKRQTEATFMQNGIAAAGDNSTPTGRSLKGMECWIGDHQSLSTGTTAGVAPDPEGSSGIGTAATDGTARDLDEDYLLAVLASAAAVGAKPDTIMANYFNRGKLNKFDIVGDTTFTDSAKGKIVGSFKIIETDFGTLDIVASPYQRERTIFVVEKGDFEALYLRPTYTRDLPTTKDATMKEIRAEVTFKVGNWHKHGAIRDLTVA